MWNVILDALIDSSIAAPFLLIIYLLIEWLERNSRAKSATVRLLNGKLAPLVAGGVGLVPQCGFSVMATDLYCQNYLKLGTLIAFFVATSDEALPILLTNKDTLSVTWIVLLVKIVYAVILGYAFNLFDKRVLNAVTDNVKLIEDEHGPHDHSHEHDHTDDHNHEAINAEDDDSDCHFDQDDSLKYHSERSESASGDEESLQAQPRSHDAAGTPDTVVHVSDGCCHHDMTGKQGFWNFVKHPLLHTLKIFVYIFVINAIFGLLLYYFEQPITNFTASLGFAQSFVTAAIGLVPNCASSVIVTSMYAEGIIGLPALLAGLVSNSGIALAILFKDRAKLKRAFLILGIMYLAGVIIGIPTYFIMQAI